MHFPNRFHLFILACSLIFGSLLQAQLPSFNKKVIQFGWDRKDSEFIEQNHKIMEQNMPFQGMGINLGPVTVNGGRKDIHYRFCSGEPFQKQWFKNHIRIFRQADFSHLKENFISGNFVDFSGRLNIYDDRLWESICNNFGVAAWVSKQSGFKGLLIDAEDYTHKRFWKYRPSSGRSWDESWEISRRRGRQFMDAIAGEFPDVSLFFFFSFDSNYTHLFGNGSHRLYKELEGCDTGLLVAFLNGIYDRLPPKARIIHGMEEYGYLARNAKDFAALRKLYDVRFRNFILPENQQKHRLQAGLAISIYLDCYINPYSRPTDYSFLHEMQRNDVSPIELLRKNIMLALETCDEYVWLWGQNRKWYPNVYSEDWKEETASRMTRVKGPLWEQAIPGITEAFRFAMAPHVFIQNKEKTCGLGKNLIVNPDFEQYGSTPARAPYWDFWQSSESSGSFKHCKNGGFDNSRCIEVKGVSDGTVSQILKIKPFGMYLVRAMMKKAPRSDASVNLNIFWKNKQGGWAWELKSNMKSAFVEDKGNGWKQASLLLWNIPEEIPEIGILVSVNQSDKNDTVLVDRVEAYDLFPAP